MRNRLGALHLACDLHEPQKGVRVHLTVRPQLPRRRRHRTNRLAVLPSLPSEHGRTLLALMDLKNDTLDQWSRSFHVQERKAELQGSSVASEDFHSPVNAPNTFQIGITTDAIKCRPFR